MKKQVIKVELDDHTTALANIGVFQRRPSLTLECEDIHILVVIQSIQYDVTDGFSSKELAVFEDEVLNHAYKKFDIDDFYDEDELHELGYYEPDCMQLAKDYKDWEDTHGNT